MDCLFTHFLHTLEVVNDVVDGLLRIEMISINVINLIFIISSCILAKLWHLITVVRNRLVLIVWLPTCHTNFLFTHFLQKVSSITQVLSGYLLDIVLVNELFKRICSQ